MGEEKDLTIGKTEESPEEIEAVVTTWIEERVDLRETIDTAIYVYEFLEAIDFNGTEILQWGMKRRLRKAKKQSLQILLKAVDDLKEYEEQDKEENDED